MDKSKYKFVTYIPSFSGQTYTLITPPASGYRPAAAENGDWDSNQFKITSVCWQGSKNAAVIWFDRAMSGGARIDILWVNGYD